jgi:RNA polymerase sigma-B factor
VPLKRSIGTADPPGVQTWARQPTDEQLFTRWREQQDQRAHEQLIARHLPMARRLATRYVGRRQPVDDLVQIASLGLVKAVDRFDPSNGAPFPAFAVPTILGELRRYFRDLGWALHVPRRMQELVSKVEQAERLLTAATGRAPAVAEVASFLELSIDEVLEALECAAADHPISLDAPAGHEDDDPETLADQLGADDAGYELIDARLTITTETARLSPRAQRILELRFVHDLTQAQIADQIGLSQMQVSRVMRAALAQLHHLAK